MEQEHRDVFISYHTNSSADTVKKICATLEGAGISCWYAPRDVGANYAQSIVQAIRSCKVFLLLLNEQANLSAHVLNEINCAFDRFRSHEDITLLPFRIDKCTLSDDVYYYLGRIHIMDGFLPPEMMRVQELVDRVCILLGKEPQRTVVVQDEHGASDGTQYRLTGSHVYPDTRFVGRADELAAVEQQLSSVPNKMALVGMGGIGKSEIAKMYLKTYTERYDVIRWVSFEESLQKTVSSDAAFPIEGLSRTSFPEDSERDYFLRKLQLLKQICDERVLFVVDNFDVIDDPDLELFCSGIYAVLFTTRYHQNCPVLPEIQVDGMFKEEDLLALFRAEYQRSLDDSALGDVKQILNLLQGHPLSIRLVASTMQTARRLKPDQMLEMLKRGEVAMQQQNAKAADIIFGRLHQVFTISSLTEEELYLLKNLALISQRGIEVETFYDWCGAEDFEVIDALIAKSWVIHDPVVDTVHLHPLVADLMVQELSNDRDCCNRLVESVHQACEVDIHYTWEKKVLLHDIADTLYDRLPENHAKRYLALDAKARLTFSMAQYEAGSLLLQQLLPHMRTLDDRLSVYNRIAHGYALSGQGELCKTFALEGLALITDIPLENLPLQLGRHCKELNCRMVEGCIILKEYELAVQYGKQALMFCERFRVENYNASRGWVDYHLGRAQYFAGQLEDAIQTIRHGIHLFLEVNDHWACNYAYDILALILLEQGDYEKALELNLKNAQFLAPLYGSEHADVGKNLEYRGMIYKAMGEHEKANGFFMQAIDIYQKLNCHNRAQQVKALMN